MAERDSAVLESMGTEQADQTLELIHNQIRDAHAKSEAGEQMPVGAIDLPDGGDGETPVDASSLWQRARGPLAKVGLAVGLSGAVTGAAVVAQQQVAVAEQDRDNRDDNRSNEADKNTQREKDINAILKVYEKQDVNKQKKDFKEFSDDAVAIYKSILLGGDSKYKAVDDPTVQEAEQTFVNGIAYASAVEPDAAGPFGSVADLQVPIEYDAANTTDHQFGPEIVINPGETGAQVAQRMFSEGLNDPMKLSAYIEFVRDGTVEHDETARFAYAEAIEASELQRLGAINELNGLLQNANAELIQFGGSYLTENASGSGTDWNVGTQENSMETQTILKITLADGSVRLFKLTCGGQPMELLPPPPARKRVPPVTRIRVPGVPPVEVPPTEIPPPEVPPGDIPPPPVFPIKTDDGIIGGGTPANQGRGSDPVIGEPTPPTPAPEPAPEVEDPAPGGETGEEHEEPIGNPHL